MNDKKTCDKTVVAKNLLENCLCYFRILWYSKKCLGMAGFELIWQWYNVCYTLILKQSLQ